MAKWFTEDAEYTQISERDYGVRRAIEKALSTHTREMEGYSYFGSNPGISEDDYDDVAESIMTALDLWEVNGGV